VPGGDVLNDAIEVFQDEATPICGLVKSSSIMPTARSIARAGARSYPRVTS